MPRFFFDITNGGFRRDQEGTECATDEDVCKVAMQTLPDIARDEIPADGQRRIFTVVVRDHEKLPVYTATLTYAGMWLRDRPEDTPSSDGAD